MFALDNLDQHLHRHLSHLKSRLPDTGQGWMKNICHQRICKTHNAHLFRHFYIPSGKGRQAARRKLIAGSNNGIRFFLQGQQGIDSLLRLTIDQPSIFTIFHEGLLKRHMIIGECGFITGQPFLGNRQVGGNRDMRNTFEPDFDQMPVAW